jgi:hypothetical protein
LGWVKHSSRAQSALKKAGNASRTRDMHLGKVPLYH